MIDPDNHQDNHRIVLLHFRQPESKRLDKFLVDQLSEFSRSRIQALIKDARVTINGLPARKAGQMLEGVATIQIMIPAPTPSTLAPEAIPLHVIYENQGLLVINKPAGMVVHPAAGHGTGTLVHAALAYAPEMEGIGGAQRPGVVHRLDKDTSGLILMAKNDHMHRWLVSQFKDRKIFKVYLALVDGRPATTTGRIETYIGRDTVHRKKMAIVNSGKGRQAITEYHILETFPEHTFLEVHPITGRTHQIRIHMSFLGCPVAGDTVYGRRKPSLALDRHFLHAFRITLQLPDEKLPRTFEAPLPEELEKVLVTLRERARI